ncbi:MAG: DUF433 domain-containing protein [Phycisphaerae bacterium]
MRWQDHVELNPNVMAGKPVIKGTRITVELILQRLGDGWTEEQLLTSYPHLKSEHIRAAQSYAAAALATDELLLLGEQS